MANPRILEYFLANKRLHDWFGNANEFDCKPFASLYSSDIDKYRKGIGFPQNNIVLFVRDTSTWNSGDSGLVITDSLIIIKTRELPTRAGCDYWESIRWDEIDYVNYHYGFEFYNAEGKLLLNAPIQYLFKGNVDESVKKELAHHLTEIAKLTNENKPIQFVCPVCGGNFEPRSSITDKYLKQTNELNAERKLNMANDLLVTYIWFLCEYTALSPDTDNPKINIKHTDVVVAVQKWFFDNWFNKSIECIECDYRLNLFDEFYSILSTDNEIFITKCLALLDTNTYFKGYYNKGFDIISIALHFQLSNLTLPMNALISLVKARCYFKLCKLHERTANEYSKYYQLATDYLTEYENNPYKGINLLKTYENELKSDMSNLTQSKNTCSGIISSAEFSETELKYLEAYHTALIEGSVSDSDRRLLERLRDSLGISQMEAGELEAILSSRLNDEKKPQLNENEEEYLSAIKDSLADGEITERRRRMLETYRNSLGISQERAKEIESMA